MKYIYVLKSISGGISVLMAGHGNTFNKCVNYSLICTIFRNLKTNIFYTGSSFIVFFDFFAFFVSPFSVFLRFPEDFFLGFSFSSSFSTLGIRSGSCFKTSSRPSNISSSFSSFTSITSGRGLANLVERFCF